MSKPELLGVVVPVITPVDKDDCVDEAAYRGVLARLVEAGVHGIFIGGSAGEGPLLTFKQWQRMAEIAFDEVGGKIPLLGGVADTSTRRVREKIDLLKRIGYRWYVVTPTFYLAIKTPAEHLRLFDGAKQAGGDMEMIAYNIPQCTGSSIDVKTLCQMGREGWIRYCKESSGDEPYLRRLIEEGQAAGLKVLVGDETLIAEGLRLGGVGIVPVCANVDPALFLRAYEAARQNDAEELAHRQEQILRLRELLVLGGPFWLAGIKHALSAQGFGSGKPVSPLEPAPEEQQKRIDAFLQNMAETSACITPQSTTVPPEKLIRS